MRSRADALAELERAQALFVLVRAKTSAEVRDADAQRRAALAAARGAGATVRQAAAAMDLDPSRIVQLSKPPANED